MKKTKMMIEFEELPEEAQLDIEMQLYKEYNDQYIAVQHYIDIGVLSKADMKMLKADENARRKSLMKKWRAEHDENKCG